MLNIKKLLTKILVDIKSRYVFEVKQVTVTIAAGQRATLTINATKSGYTPIGIIGIYVPDTDVFAVHEFYIQDANTAKVILQNAYTESRSSDVWTRILYQKN